MMATIIHNARVRLGRGAFCEAILIDNGRVVRTGASGDILRDAPAGAGRIDAGGALVLPAFNDSHLHLMWVGRRMRSIECAGAKSIDDVVRLGREHMEGAPSRKGEYVLGYGVNPDLFTEGERRDPNRNDLDKISRAHPVILSRHCGHTVYCNSRALEMAGFGESAPEVSGGTFEKDGGGRPTGVVRENADALVRKPMPAFTREQMRGFVKLATEKAHSLGITACGSYDSDGPDFDDIVGAYRDECEEARGSGKPPLRVSMQCGISCSERMLDARLAVGPSGTALWEDGAWGRFLQLGSIKIFGDGTLGGRTAWMREPYADAPGERGFPLLDGETFNHFVRKAAAGGMQVLVHAIGDACVDSVVSAYEKVTKPGSNPLRHGIIHCQFTTPDLLERIARNRILALVQPIFLADDIGILESRVGRRLASTSYAWGSMNALGIDASYSTDAPVSSLDPLECISWAVLRGGDATRASMPDGFCPAERVDADTAFDAYTLASARSAFAEDSLGRIAPGYLADLVFLDRDIFALPPEEIRRARVLRTMCAGETVYSC